MVRDLLSDEPTFVSDFEALVQRHQLVKALCIVRARAGLSQQELASRMQCSQSKISKLESAADADLKFGDIESYLQATKHEARMILVPEGGSLVDEVKMHAFQIKHLLDRMVILAGSDGSITEGVASFIEEAAFNLTRITKMAAGALPRISAKSSGPVQVDTPEPEDDVESMSPKPVTKQRTSFSLGGGRPQADCP